MNTSYGCSPSAKPARNPSMNCTNAGRVVDHEHPLRRAGDVHDRGENRAATDVQDPVAARHRHFQTGSRIHDRYSLCSVADAGGHDFLRHRGRRRGPIGPPVPFHSTPALAVAV